MSEELEVLAAARAPLTQKAANDVLRAAQSDAKTAARLADELDSDPVAVIKRYFSLTPDQSVGLSRVKADYLRSTFAQVSTALRDGVKVTANIKTVQFEALSCTVGVSYTPPNPTTGDPGGVIIFGTLQP